MSELPVSLAESIPKLKTRDDLDDFLAYPVTLDEVGTKPDFIAKVQPWLSDALMVAGYPPEKLDGRLIEAFEGTDFFTREPATIANDINRIITILFAEAASLVNEAVAGSTVEVNHEQNAVLPPLVSGAEQQKKTEATPVALTPAVEKMQLTEKMLVGKSALALEEIIGKEFSLDAYREVTETADVAMNLELEAVKMKAKEKLRRHSDTYVPKPSEKVALQLLPSLLAENARLSVLRAKNANNLKQSDGSIDVDTIKQTATDFISALENIQNTIDNLNQLIDTAEGEPNQPLTEAYRAQFEKLRIDGNKVLATLPQNHSRYIEFKDLIDSDLSDLITATSADQGGDKVVIEDHPTLLARRDRIKSAIAYMKAESDYLSFVIRTKPKVASLILKLQGVSGLSNDQMNLLHEKLDTLRQLTSKFNPQVLPATTSLSATAPEIFDEASVKLGSDKANIIDTVNESKTILESWPAVFLQTSESPDQQIITDEELGRRLDGSPIGKEIKRSWDTIFKNGALYHSHEVIKRREALQAKGLGERLLNVIRQIPVRNVGKIAALAALFAVTPAKDGYVTQSGGSVTAASINGVIPTTFPVFNVASVGENLRSVHSTEIETVAVNEVPPPQVNNVIPELSPQSIKAEEVIPGMNFLSDPVSQEVFIELEKPVFSNLADETGDDEDMAFQKPPVYEVQLEPHLIQSGDSLSSICKELPFMKEINPAFTEKLILALSKKLDGDASLRERLGGVGDDSDLLFKDQYIDREFLNLLVQDTAFKIGLLQ